MLRWWLGCRSLWEPDCSDRRAAWHQRCSDLLPSHCPGGISRLRNERRSHFFAFRALRDARSDADLADPLRQSPESCGGMRLRAAAGWSIGRRLPNGMPIDRPVAPSRAKFALNTTLRTYVEDRLAGVVVAPSGAPVPGPAAPWKSRRHGRRKDRRWAMAWSPEQIARRLPIDFPDDKTMRISHEAIYQALFVQGRGALRRELTACLRTGRVLRVPRARVRRRGKGFVSPEIMISQRPAEAADRAVPGHWEGDLILGLGSSAIGTLVERTTRFTMLLHLPRLAGHGEAPRTKNGPAFAGHGAEAVRDAITRTIIDLARRTASFADLGSGSRNGAARSSQDRRGYASLLL